MSTLAFLRDNARWLAAGYLMTVASSVGQTFFIAIFSEPLRQEFALSHGGFGTIYMIGTLASAATIIQLGRLADHVPARRLVVGIGLALAGACIAMMSVGSWFMLIGVIFGLRLFGQGLMTHLATTCMARWFHATRGRALAVASFGFPTGEALAPLVAVALIAAIGWRQTWGVAALATVVLVAVIWLLLAERRQARGKPVDPEQHPGLDGRHWSRADVLKHPLFWLLVPGILSSGFILTVVFFLPAHIAEIKGWDFADLPARYWIYAVTSVAASVMSGVAIDRFSARACLPFYQLPMLLGLLALSMAGDVGTMSVVMALLGVTAGASQTVHSALWAELYGTRQIGAIKALTQAIMVFSTAAGPGIVGSVIDLGYDFSVQAVWLAIYVGAVSVLNTVLLLVVPMMRSTPVRPDDVTRIT